MNSSIRAIWDTFIYVNFVSASTLYFCCVWNNSKTRISLTSFSLQSLRGQGQNLDEFYSDLFRAGNIRFLADPADDCMWVSSWPVILYISRIGKNVFAQHKRAPALTGAFWSFLYFLLLLLLFLETSDSAKNIQEYKNNFSSSWCNPGYQLLYFI